MSAGENSLTPFLYSRQTIISDQVHMRTSHYPQLMEEFKPQICWAQLKRGSSLSIEVLDFSYSPTTDEPPCLYTGCDEDCASLGAQYLSHQYDLEVNQATYLLFLPNNLNAPTSVRLWIIVSGKLLITIHTLILL